MSDIITDDLTYMLAMTMEYVNSVCDESYIWDDFFESRVVRGFNYVSG